MELKVKKLHPDAVLPSYAHTGDAGMDIYALERTIIPSGERVAVRSGLAFEIPEGYAGLCWDKSGLAVKHGLTTLAGVIDAGYRGELLVALTNLGETKYVFDAGDKIAQMLIQKVERPNIVEADELNETPRGEGGFGSTGK